MKKAEYQHPTIEIAYFIDENIVTTSGLEYMYDGEGDILVWEP